MRAPILAVGGEEKRQYGGSIGEKRSERETEKDEGIKRDGNGYGGSQTGFLERCPVELVESRGVVEVESFAGNCKNCPMSRDFAEGWFVGCHPEKG